MVSFTCAAAVYANAHRGTLFEVNILIFHAILLPQLMPYFVMIIFSSVPGLPGLFVACAFSGTLRFVH